MWFTLLTLGLDMFCYKFSWRRTHSPDSWEVDSLSNLSQSKILSLWIELRIRSVQWSSPIAMKALQERLSQMTTLRSWNSWQKMIQIGHWMGGQHQRIVHQLLSGSIIRYDNVCLILCFWKCRLTVQQHYLPHVRELPKGMWHMSCMHVVSIIESVITWFHNRQH